jgi:hypothetical protein
MAGERYRNRIHPMSTRLSLGRLSKGYAHEPPHLPALPPPVRRRRTKAGVCGDLRAAAG